MNTPDLKLAISSLVKKEFDHIRSTSPKFIIDAGANIGTSAVFFAKKYPAAKIIAVEPEDGNFKLLLKNTSSFQNITVIKAAIWGSVEKRTVQNRFTGHWGYTVADTHNKIESTGQDINCITIDSIMKDFNIEKIDLLKMDIEGCEKDVFENSSGWINSVSVITVELHEGICAGCRRAFYLATKDFKTFEKHGEKITAYKDE
jgi:FkbM family methyltransferase